jgi:rod shape-determining protein MreD
VRSIRFAAGLALAVLVYAAGVRIAPASVQAVDLFLVVAVLNALDGNAFAGLAGGLAAGLAQDALTGGLFGLYGFADTLIGYATARAAQRLVIERASGVLPVVAVATVVQQAVVVGLAWLLLPDPRFPDPRWLAVRALTCGLLGALIYASGGWWRRRLAEQRLRRMHKLH